MWKVILHAAVKTWISDQNVESQEQIEEAFELLRDLGPNLRRPFVGKISHSRIANLKELRPASKGTSEIRILFAFDPERQAIILVAGDKRGTWNHWYQKNIPIAEKRFDEWLEK